MSEKRLLIVDDEPEFGEFVCKVAHRLGYEARVTTHSRAFQNVYRELHPTHIVMDMVMPEMDGNELVLWLMEQHYAGRLIIITGYSPEYAQDARVLAEFSGLRSVVSLTKPIELAKLREVLSSN